MKKNTVWIVVLVIVLLLSVGIHVVQHMHYQTESADKEFQIAELEETLATKQNKVWELQEEKNFLKSQVNALAMELGWPFEDIVFVNDEYGVYHKFGCDLSPADGIMDRQEAGEKGYSRCMVCCDDWIPQQ